MRAKISFVLSVFLLVGTCAQFSFAQAKEQKPQLWFVEEHAVKPSAINELEAVLKECIEAYKKYDWPYPMTIYSSEDFHYYLFYPVENYIDVEKFFKLWGELVSKWGEDKFQALMKRFGNSAEYYKQFFVRSVPELSFIPKKPRLKPEEKNIFVWDMIYLIPGREKEFEALGKKMIALMKSKNYNDEMYMSTGDIGTDMPVYVGGLFGKDFADLYVQNKKMWELMGDEGGKMFDQMLSYTRKRESKQGWYRPDLSYTPAPKKK